MFGMVILVPSFASALPTDIDFAGAEDAVTETVEAVEETATVLPPAEEVVAPVSDALEPVTDAVDPVVDAVDPVVDAVEPVTDELEPVTDAVDPATGQLDPVTTVLDPVTDAIDEPVRDVVEPVTDTIDEPVTDTVKDPVRDAVDPVTDPVKDPVRDVADPVTDTVDPVVDRGTEAVPPVVDTVTDTVPDPHGPTTIDDPQSPTGSGVATDGDGRLFGPAGVGTRVASGRSPYSLNAADAGATRDLPGLTGLPVLSGTAGAAAALDSTMSLASQPGESPLATAGRVLRQAAEAFKFPLLVAAGVLLFLALQSRLDRRDPKLAAAATDEELRFA